MMMITRFLRLPPPMFSLGTLVLAFALLLALTPARAATVRISVREAGKSELLPARVHLAVVVEGRVEPVQPAPSEGNALPFWKDHASAASGRVDFDVTPGGRYRLEVERGPEWSRHSQLLEIADDPPAVIEVPVSLGRLVDMAAEGWWSGEMHIHRPLDQVEALMRAEDLHFGQVISWWNRNNLWNNAALPESPVRRFDGNRFVQLLGGEDERDGGALLYFNLPRPLDITAGERHYPSSLLYARQAQAAGAWIDIEKPFWWDVPMWIAHGVGDSIGIANNHLYRRGALDNEAWGRARDLEKYPGPLGNGLWTQDIYYHLLNCGIRIPPSAGAASGVLPNPVGYNRVYVRVDGSEGDGKDELSMSKWFAWLKAGRAFVTNGPLLRVTANGRHPGHVFRGTENSMLITLDANVDGNDPVERLEVVQNGEVKPFPFPGHLAVHESGWFLVRAITNKADGLGFASTAPFYVELGERKSGPRQRESARFFVQWCEERMATLRANPDLSAAQKQELRQPWDDALAFWRQKEAAAPPRVTVRGQVTDASTGELVPARVHIQAETGGGWHFVESADPGGSAVRYEKRNWVNAASEEFHTTLSAHPFVTHLEPGRYVVTVERGKEFMPLTRTLEVSDTGAEWEFPLRRWINMSERGWYSGDTHVHRTLADLPNVMLAEDLNVAFPLTYWVTHAFTPPTAGDHTSQETIPDALVKVDDTHVIWPRNTEWEIFSVGAQRHTLGAVFALGHREPFESGVPTVKNVAAEARAQGALLDLDKHDWPWSMTLPPNMGVHLYELANNHIWRAPFAFTNWSSPAPAWLRPPQQEATGGERDWILFTMENYYALMNCGLNMAPTGGTASGVHPVPLGFGRVYVQLPGGFDYEGWKDGLKKGRSFVTTGPMLLATVNDRPPGERFAVPAAAENKLFRASILGGIVSERKLTAIEVIIDGHVARSIIPSNEPASTGGYLTTLDTQIDIPATASTWLALRCWEDRPEGRLRYAHTAPWHIVVPDRPIRPRQRERDYLVDRVKAELERSRGVLPPEAILEYQEALAYYSNLPARSE